MNAAISQAKNVLFVHAMGALEGLSGLFGYSSKVRNEDARVFAPNATLLQVKGLKLYNEKWTSRFVMQGIKDHIAKHGKLDELVIYAHGGVTDAQGVTPYIVHFGGAEQFLQQLKKLQTELGKPITSRVVFFSCYGFIYGRDAQKRIETLQSYASDLNAELVGATSMVEHFVPANSNGPSIFGRFVKIAPDGTITRDLLDTPPELVKEQQALAAKAVKPWHKMRSWPTRAQWTAARKTTTVTEFYKAMGWDAQDFVNKSLATDVESTLKNISKEAPWAKEHFAPAKAVQAASHAVSQVSQVYHASPMISSIEPKGNWGPAAMIGGIACIGVAWIANVARKRTEPTYYQPRPAQPLGC